MKRRVEEEKVNEFMRTQDIGYEASNGAAREGQVEKTSEEVACD